MTPLQSVPLRSCGQVGKTWMLAQHLWHWITFLNRNPSFLASHSLTIRMTSNGWYCYCTFSASILFVTKLWILDIFHLEKWKDKDFLEALEIFKQTQDPSRLFRKERNEWPMHAWKDREMQTKTSRRHTTAGLADPEDTRVARGGAPTEPVNDAW